MRFTAFLMRQTEKSVRTYSSKHINKLLSTIVSVYRADSEIRTTLLRLYAEWHWVYQISY